MAAQALGVEVGEAMLFLCATLALAAVRTELKPTEMHCLSACLASAVGGTTCALLFRPWLQQRLHCRPQTLGQQATRTGDGSEALQVIGTYSSGRVGPRYGHWFVHLRY